MHSSSSKFSSSSSFLRLKFIYEFIYIILYENYSLHLGTNVTHLTVFCFSMGFLIFALPRFFCILCGQIIFYALISMGAFEKISWPDLGGSVDRICDQSSVQSLFFFWTTFCNSETLWEGVERERLGSEESLLHSVRCSRIRNSWLLHLVFGHRSGFAESVDNV